MSAIEALELDSQARRQALNVHRSMLLQAPAGSGKTTVLTARFLALLAVVDAPRRFWRSPSLVRPRPRCTIAFSRRCRPPRAERSLPGIEPALLQAVVQRDRTLRLAVAAQSVAAAHRDHRCAEPSARDALPVAARRGTRLEIAPAPSDALSACCPAALRSALRGTGRRGGGGTTAGSARQQLAAARATACRYARAAISLVAARAQARASGLAERVAESVDAVLRSSLAGAGREAAARRATARRRATAQGCISRGAGGPLECRSGEPAALARPVRAGDDQPDAWRRRFRCARATRRTKAIASNACWIGSGR